jgi:preprotein translocase subunit SecG
LAVAITRKAITTIVATTIMTHIVVVAVVITIIMIQKWKNMSRGSSDGHNKHSNNVSAIEINNRSNKHAVRVLRWYHVLLWMEPN